METKQLKLSDYERQQLHKMILGAIALRARFRDRLKANGIDVENGDSNELYDAINAGYASLIQAHEIDNRLNEEQ
jgi:hypothetical protein